VTVAAVDLPYLWTPTIKGNRYAYYRRFGRRDRLPAIEAPDFLAAYQRAHAAAEAEATAAQSAGPEKVIPGSLAALIVAYRSSDAWRGLSPASRDDYDVALTPLRDRYGHLPVATMPRAFVFKLRDEYAQMPAMTKGVKPKPVLDADGKQVIIATPRRANRIVAVLRLLFSWGVDRGWRKDNPALRPGRLKTGPGYATWKPADVAAFLSCEAIGEPMKRALLLGLGTGQRKGDCLTMTKAARQGGAIEVVQAKTGTRLWLPEHADLTHALDAAPKHDALTLLTRPDGKPWKLDHFNHAFVEATRAAGLTGLSFHGLRKTAAAWLAEAGASASEIAAITGHRTLGEVTRYTAGADQKSRATAAMGKLASRRIGNAARTPIDKPSGGE
jgi:integrase